MFQFNKKTRKKYLNNGQIAIQLAVKLIVRKATISDWKKEPYKTEKFCATSASFLNKCQI